MWNEGEAVFAQHGRLQNRGVPPHMERPKREMLKERFSENEAGVGYKEE